MIRLTDAYILIIFFYFSKIKMIRIKNKKGLQLKAFLIYRLFAYFILFFICSALSSLNCFLYNL